MKEKRVLKTEAGFCNFQKIDKGGKKIETKKLVIKYCSFKFISVFNFFQLIMEYTDHLMIVLNLKLSNILAWTSSIIHNQVLVQGAKLWVYPGSSYQASTLTGKNGGVVLVPCCAWKCRYNYLRWCGCLLGPWVSFVTADEFSKKFTKITS